MQLIDKILPSEANNKYLGNRIALFGLIFTTCLMTWRSCVHLLYQDAGLNSIGSFIIFEGIPDPNQMIYMLGSVWGDRKSTRLNSSHALISYAVFCLKKKKSKDRISSRDRL